MLIRDLAGCWWSGVRAAGGGLVFGLWIAACTPQPETPQGLAETAVGRALEKVGLTVEALSLPKLGRPYSTPGRLAVVDAALQRPVSMVGLSRRLAEIDPIAGARAAYLAHLLAELGTELSYPVSELVDTAATAELLAAMMPADKVNDARLKTTLHLIFSGILQVQQIYQGAGGKPGTRELAALQDHLQASVSYGGPELDPRRLMPTAYHAIGERIELEGLATAVVQLLAVVEEVLPRLRDIIPPDAALEWSTPLGRVRIAGGGNDHHSGAYALLIDLGGDDVYQDVGQPLEPGRISVVIDLAGNDTVRWEKSAGPGAGLLGISLWLDADGNDNYTGSNMGMGVGLLGAGVLWDIAGNDHYQGGSMVEGVGQYGVGILIDEAGDDDYAADLYGQGFGGPGGIGIQVDLLGNDSFFCGGLVPDRAPDRRERHEKVHYISMCQGYAFGIRPQISGGVGLLLDREGNDHYRADLFAQGSSYWFGLGMLVDRAGNDSYDAFEHCQGESLHLGAAILGDWAGDDSYSGYEHCQGVGIDRAAGVLYDYRGDDSYQATRLSQGTGLKPFGAGMLIDVTGNDRYQSSEGSQGYARKPAGFPESQWPVGMLLDLGGEDVFEQPDVPPVTAQGRVRGRQGIAIQAD